MSAPTVVVAFRSLGAAIRGMHASFVILDEALRTLPKPKRRPVIHNGRKPTARRKAR